MQQLPRWSPHLAILTVLGVPAQRACQRGHLLLRLRCAPSQMPVEMPQLRETVVWNNYEITQHLRICSALSSRIHSFKCPSPPGEHEPQLFALINQNPDGFVAMLNEPIAQPAAGQARGRCPSSRCPNSGTPQLAGAPGRRSARGAGAGGLGAMLLV